jgi:hypothetical protein
MFVYLCLAWTVGPSVVPLYVCLGLGRPLPFGECPCLIDQPSLVLTNAGLWPRLLLAKFWRPYPISSWTSWFSPTNDLGNANLSLFDLEIFCFIDSISDWHIGFCLEVCLIHLQPSHVLGCLSVLISCCCPTWPDLMLIFHLLITLVDARHVWNLSKSPLLSCLQQLSYVILCCVSIFGLPRWF